MLRVQGTFTLAPGSPYYNALYFGGLTQGEAQAAAVAAASFWGHLDNALRADMAYTTGSEVELVDITSGQVTDVFSVTPADVDFTGTLEPLPPANQGLVRLRTNFFANGRRIRGRIFVPGPTEGWTSTGSVNGTTLTNLQDAVNLLIANGGAAGGLQVYSVTHHIAAPVVSGSPWTEFAVQRSRRD